ncbi:MAG: hypothetical protein MPJ25_00430 [Pirellulales bacterium]|nr:hypothetical protein [Pirellulales bacterium]
MAIGDVSFQGASGLNTAYLQPTQGKNLYAGNYLDFTSSTHQQWAQQFLPDVYEKEIEIYGNRTISSFLRMVSAEMPSTSDQIIWLEQGRLHTRYTGLTLDADVTAAGQDGVFTLPGQASPESGSDAEDALRRVVPSQTTEGDNQVNFRVGQTVMVQQESGAHRASGTPTTDTSRGTGTVGKGIVTVVTDTTFTVVFYNNPGFTAASNTFTALVYGSEFAKGTGNFTDKLDPTYTTYQNSPIIMKEHYSINGSDTGQIGWIEVTSENGASGYLWYVKAEHENRLRWEDYQEMAMLEAVPYSGSNATALPENGASDFGGTLNSVQTGNQNARGTQGFFHALEQRGNIYDGLAGQLFTAGSGAPTTTGIVALQDTFDVILKQMDKQGAIEENMMYVNRDLALALDNFIATQNNYGGVAGVSWGVFNSNSDMAVNLGFSGFRRGSYDFYKTDWKYLNDYSTRGGFGDIEGVLIPAGTSTVYDQNLGKNIKRPFLHLRYRASETDNRKMKSWITGSVGGAYTTDVDELRMHYLTEKCLITQGANNFFLLQS